MLLSVVYTCRPLAGGRRWLLPLAPSWVGSPSGSLCHSLKISFVPLASPLRNAYACCLLRAAAWVLRSAICPHQRPCWQLSRGSPSACEILYHGRGLRPGGRRLVRRLQPRLAQENPAIPGLWEQRWLYFSVCQAAGFLASLLLCAGARRCAAPLAQPPPTLCPCALWLCLGEALPMEHPRQLLQVVLGQSPSDSAFGVGHRSHDRHPRNLWQG